MIKITLTVILGGLILGESVALLVGTTIIKSKISGWLQRKNGFLLGLDVILAVLIILAIPALQYFPRIFFSLFLLIGIASHSYRTLEYYSKKERYKFCANLPLFIVNNIKLIGFIVILGFEIL